MGCDLSVAVFRTSCIGMFCNGLPQVVYLSGWDRLAHTGRSMIGAGAQLGLIVDQRWK